MLGFKNVSIEKACLMKFTLGLHYIKNKILLAEFFALHIDCTKTLYIDVYC